MSCGMYTRTNVCINGSCLNVHVSENRRVRQSLLMERPARRQPASHITRARSAHRENDETTQATHRRTRYPLGHVLALAHVRLDKVAAIRHLQGAVVRQVQVEPFVSVTSASANVVYVCVCVCVCVCVYARARMCGSLYNRAMRWCRHEHRVFIWKNNHVYEWTCFCLFPVLKTRQFVLDEVHIVSDS
jgi:hypothetical protein